MRPRTRATLPGMHSRPNLSHPLRSQVVPELPAGPRLPHRRAISRHCRGLPVATHGHLDVHTRCGGLSLVTPARSPIAHQTSPATLVQDPSKGRRDLLRTHARRSRMAPPRTFTYRLPVALGDDRRAARRSRSQGHTQAGSSLVRRGRRTMDSRSRTEGTGRGASRVAA